MNIQNANLLEASSRVAFAALVHDLGKFAERAEMAVAKAEIDQRKKDYCPKGSSKYTHAHAAYSALALQALKGMLPDFQSGDMFPFDTSNETLIAAAAGHHEPKTSLQRIVAIADRLASGFERSNFTEYERLQEGDAPNGVGLHRARQWPMLETIYPDQQNLKEPKQRFPLKALAPETLFPGGWNPGTPDEAKAEYRELWDAFISKLETLSHRNRLPLWLDHFDSLFLTFTHAIPSATVSRENGRFTKIPTDVSLYDHSKAVAALAVALWRYHLENGTVEEVFSKSKWNHWDEHDVAEFLLIQGDFSGIQAFIFDSAESTSKAAKRLRGRSFMVSLLTELAALKVLETLELPSTSQIINAAGRFLIVAPNRETVQQKLEGVRRELDEWFLQQTFGQSGIALVTTEASRQDFHKERFAALMDRLFVDAQRRKRQRFGLCGETPPAPIFEAVDYPNGPCVVDGHKPGEILAEGKYRCRLCNDQITAGDQLVKQNLLLIGYTVPQELPALEASYFGYRVAFAREEKGGDWLRVWDFALPEADGKTPLWNGYARRAINAHVPRNESGELLDFETIAKTAIVPDESGNPRGVAALGILKGDVDNLGAIFRKGLEHPTFARMAGLSRQVNAFFAIWLPWWCSKEFPNTYTVFAGGDDFFLIGPWLEQIHLAREICKALRLYGGKNPKVHLSAGLVMTKPDLPVPALDSLAEEALQHAKNHADKTKNAITCWNRTVSWQVFEEMMQAEEELTTLTALLAEEKVEMSSGYLYSLLDLCDRAESPRPEDQLWRSWFVYRTWRFVVDRLPEEKREPYYKDEFVAKIGKRLLCRSGDYKIALFTHLYQRREA
ncbi:MAG: type III-A CRISPR-associated protein Cas10/Csm1 [Magnetococcales bacterium]|nr:type III-A CRISPR-associated protein Cas10/Csm1 [Magnetococcales bacterium]